MFFRFAKRTVRTFLKLLCIGIEIRGAKNFCSTYLKELSDLVHIYFKLRDNHYPVPSISFSW